MSALAEQDSKRVKDFVARIVQERDEARAAQRESTNVVQSPTQPEKKANGEGRGRNWVRKLRQTPVETAIGELIPQPHGGALRRGNPGNRGGAEPVNDNGTLYGIN